ncbi:MAG: hypothetical protein WBD10_08050 [Acidobacteriaceae bacterium]
MKILLTLVSLVLLPASLLGQISSKPVVSHTALTADQVAIYRTFLSSYNTGLDAQINVADMTSEFMPDPNDFKGCLKEFGPSTASEDVHRFSTEFSGLRKLRLIDPNTHKIADPGIAIRQGVSVNDAVKAGFEAGVLTLSEIIFDPTHHYAAFSYSFHCGSLCGNGGTVVYELKDGKWVKSKRFCSFWES